MPREDNGTTVRFKQLREAESCATGLVFCTLGGL
jgi:hypothetical protein